MSTPVIRLSVILGLFLFSTVSSQKSPILFLSTRINYAWGFVYDGWFIDSSGIRYDYSFSNADSIDYFNQTETIPNGMFEKLLEAGVPAGVTIPDDTLSMMREYIEPAVSGEVTFEGMCADFGIYRYSAFSWDSDAGRPKEVICYQMGDQTACNSSNAAKNIARWLLEEIDGQDFTSCGPPDSCLQPSTTIRPAMMSQHPKMPSDISETVTLNGQKASVRIRQLMVQEGKKALPEMN